MSAPRKRRVPADCAFSPAITRSVVVLPAAFGADQRTISPLFTSRLTPFRTWTLA